MDKVKGTFPDEITIFNSEFARLENVKKELNRKKGFRFEE